MAGLSGERPYILAQSALLPGKSTPYPVTDQPIFEILALAHLDPANDTIDESAQR